MGVRIGGAFVRISVPRPFELPRPDHLGYLVPKIGKSMADFSLAILTTFFILKLHFRGRRVGVRIGGALVRISVPWPFELPRPDHLNYLAPRIGKSMADFSTAIPITFFT